MRRRVALAMGLALALVLGAGGGRAAAYRSATWYEGADGWARARRQQRTEGAPILVYFRAEWCPHCHALDEMLEERDVAARLLNVIKVRIEPEDGDEEQDLFSEEFESDAYPALFLVSPGGARRRLSTESAKRLLSQVGSSRVDLQACKLEYSIVSPK